MSYSPPNYDACDFNFSRGAYSSSAFDACDFNFLPPTLIVGSSWATIGVGDGSQTLENRHAVEGVGGEVPRIGSHWATEGAPAEAMVLESRYAVDAPALEIHERGAAFGVDGAVSMVAFAAERAYATLAGTMQTAWAGRRWLTLGLPVETPMLGALWATAAPVLQIAQRGDVFGVEGVESAYSLSTQVWAVSVPSYVEVPFNESWFWNMIVANELEIVYGASLATELEVVYPLGAEIVATEVEITSPMLTQVATELEVPSPIRNFDVVASELEVRYSILDGSVIYAPGPPTLSVRGETLIIDDVEVEIEEGEFAWTCQVVLPDPDRQLGLFGVDEPFEVTIGGETFSFIRQEPRTSRTGPAQRSAVISGISPSAIYANPRGERITKTWASPTLVSVILEELFGSNVVDLRILDWAVPADRLAVTAQTPIEIAQAIAKASGAVLESEPDGSLYIRALWPVSVPFLDTAAADHVYDDARDVYTIESRVSPQRIENKIRIVDAIDAGSGLLQAEVDAREGGHNQGRTNFVPGDQPALLIFKSSNVELDTVRSSAGNIAPLPAGTMEVEESLTFADSAEAQLRYPTAALDAFEWLGNDLGTPVLSGERTLRLEAPGIGVLHVTYTTAFEAKRVSGVPTTLAGETEFDVLVVVEGTQT